MKLLNLNQQKRRVFLKMLINPQYQDGVKMKKE